MESDACLLCQRILGIITHNDEWLGGMSNTDYGPLWGRYQVTLDLDS